MSLKTEEVCTSNEGKSMKIQAIPQVIAVTIKNILLLAFGMTLGYPTILIPGLSDPNESIQMNEERLSWIGSINLICVPIGCILSGGISQWLGRRRAMQVINIPFVIAWFLFKFAATDWQVFMALALTGLSGGFLEAPVLTYVAEITQPHLRGMLSSTSSMAVFLGILIMFVLGTLFPWRTVALISCIFNIASFNLLFFVPESPHWLISKNRLLDARKSLAWLRGWTTLDDIEGEYKQMYREIRASQMNGIDNPAFEGNITSEKPQERTWFQTAKLFTKKNFLWPFGIITFCFYLSHFCGSSNLQTYAIAIFRNLRAPIDKYYATVILGIINLIGSIVCVILVHYTGKRMLNIFTLLGYALCYIVIGSYAFLLGINDITIGNTNVTQIDPLPEGYEGFTWIPLVFLLFASFLAHMGIRVLPWILTGELFANETRAAAAGLCSTVSYILGFICNKTFLWFVSAITFPGLLWFNAATSLIGLIILHFILPETEGKTLGQINEHFAGGRKMGKKVFRGYAKEEYNGNTISMGNVNNAYIGEKLESKL